LAFIAATIRGHPQLLQSVMDINQNQRTQADKKHEDALGGVDGCLIGVLGLNFAKSGRCRTVIPG
jgi:UDP-glucose 6-dehydrogenase